MSLHTLFVQNVSPLTSSSHSSFFPVVHYRISNTCRFHSVQLYAHIPSHHLQPIHEEECPEAEALPGDGKAKKKKRKKKDLRPNFYHQTLKKWSAKISSQRTSFPWQEQKIEENKGAIHCPPAADLLVEPRTNHTSLALLDGTAEVGSTQFFKEVDASEPVEKLSGSSKHERPGHSQHPTVQSTSKSESERLKFEVRLPSAPWVQGVQYRRSNVEHKNRFLGRDSSLNFRKNERESFQDASAISVHDVYSKRLESRTSEDSVEAASSISSKNHKCDPSPKSSASSKFEKLEESIYQRNQNATSRYYRGSYQEDMTDSLIDADSSKGPVSFPWDKWKDGNNTELPQKRSNTDIAERTIPEFELRRLRNEALKMKERMKMGPGGVTEAIVEDIHRKWKETEVVKLHIEGPPALNMKRTHEILEKKTGGIVIWRSGSSIVLYRGLTYKLPCARSFSNIPDTSYDSTFSNHSITVEGLKQSDRDIDLTSSDSSVVDSILDQLGPRYKDWSGHDPLPVDADLLPGIIPGYKPPFRFLPYRTKRNLTNRQMTFLRRFARSMAPHFALGRNKDHQGLGNGIVKLWETTAIVKIAIKRGVQNTSNERMAEEIKALTGGTLLSRNKDYIVFYRGNDFLTPSIRQTLIEREKLATVQQDAEEDARFHASGLIHSNITPSRGPFIAGTLAETLEAYKHWGNQPSSEDRDEMRTDLALSQHESLVRYLERKLYFAIEKVRNAEKALAQLQESLLPTNLPTDLETVTDEERILFRNIGLKMRSSLPLGRRGIFDGTIQNIHLNWKHMELAKVIVKRKNLAQVKHIAISLEAETGGVLISVDKTTKGYVIVLYRGKNYQRPQVLRPQNLLSKREALARSIELQRREALNHHIGNLHEEIRRQKSYLARLKLHREIGSEGSHFDVVDSSSGYDTENAVMGEMKIQRTG